MNKTELIEHIAKQADISKAAAGRALEATIGAVRTTLKKRRHCRFGWFRYICRHQACCSRWSQPAYWCCHQNQISQGA